VQQILKKDRDDLQFVISEESEEKEIPFWAKRKSSIKNSDKSLNKKEKS